MKGRSIPSLSAERQPVKALLAPTEIGQTCHLCGRLRSLSEIHSDYRSGYAVCWDARDCRRYRNGEATVIKVHVPHVTCSCCGGKLPNGRQHVVVQSGRIFHWSHQLCTGGCTEDAPEAAS
jgi:hypothetical protein